MEIQLTRPFPLLLDALAKPTPSVPFIMPERLARTDPMKAITEMVGSGPYRFLPGEYVSGSRVAYAKFDGYVPRSGSPGLGDRRQDRAFPAGRMERHSRSRHRLRRVAARRGGLVGTAAERPAAGDSLRNTDDRACMIAGSVRAAQLMRLNHLQPPFNDVRHPPRGADRR